jgi:YidC/Oxa1 family membrane protein insertase
MSVTVLLSALLFYFYSLLGNWGLAIIAFTLLMRLAFFPAQAFQFFQRKKLDTIQPEIERLKAVHEHDSLALYKDLSQLKTKAGVKTLPQLLLLVFQLPLFYWMYRAVAALPGLAGAGFLWVPSLAMADGFFILPMLVALFSFAQMKLNRMDEKPEMRWAAVAPLISLIFTAALPAGLVLYYATSGFLQWAGELALKKWGA